MWKIVQLAIPSALGVVAFLGMSVSQWDGVRQGLTVALSVICAAVFVRLARGLPLTTTEFFEVAEIRDLSKATKEVMKRMIVVVTVTFASIFALAFSPMIFALAAALPTSWQPDKIVAAWSGVVMFLLGFTFVRAFRLIQGDYDLVELQVTLVTRTVERRRAKEEADRLDKAEAKEPFAPPPGYGRNITH